MLYKPDGAITGMAIGADQIWAHAAIHMNIPTVCAIPFRGQEHKWPKATQEWYNHILWCAKKIYFVCDGGYSAWKMQKRNEWMVDNCDLLLAVWDGSAGGTKNCLDYAAHKGMTIENGKVIRFDPSTL